MLLLEVQKKTLFAKLDDVYPECSLFIDGEPQLHPLKCLVDSCHRGKNCMEILVKRIKYIFDQWPEAQLLYLYFSYRDMPGSQRAGRFWRDLSEPTYTVMNRSAWQKMKQLGIVYQWDLPQELFLNPDKLIQLGDKSI